MRTRSVRWWLPVGGVAVIAAVLLSLGALGVFDTQRNGDTPERAAQRFATAMVARDAATVTGLICDPARATAFAARLTAGPDRTTVATLVGPSTVNGDTATQRVHYVVQSGVQRQAGDSDIVMTRRSTGAWCVTGVVAAG